MELKGTPTALICTDEFATLGQAEAEALGLASLPIVVVPHPLGGLKEGEVLRRAEVAVGEVVKVLTSPRDRLAQEHRGKEYPAPKMGIKPKPIFS